MGNFSFLFFFIFFHSILEIIISCIIFYRTFYGPFWNGEKQTGWIKDLEPYTTCHVAYPATDIVLFIY